MTAFWQEMAVEDLAWLLARLPTREAQWDFLSLLRYAVASIPISNSNIQFPHVGRVEEFSIHRWPFMLAYAREMEKVIILRLLPSYGGFDSELVPSGALSAPSTHR